MKKIALTSLIAMFAFAGAHAANTIDGNPLYMPKAGHFYSISDLKSHSESIETWALNEDFGFGITDRLAVNVSTTLVDAQSFDQWAWDDMTFGVAFRALNKGGWKLDLIGKYAVDPIWGNHAPFLDKDYTDYTWTAGVRGGYTNARFAVAGHALFNYENTESFNWNEKAGEEGIHTLKLGVDAQLVLSNRWNLVAGAEYTGRLDKEHRGIPGATIKNAGTWEGMFGANYNIDTTKFVGAYVTGTMRHATGDWETDDGFGFGAKFGIDF